MRFQQALNETFCTTPSHLTHRRLKHRQNQKLTKQCFLPPPHRFSTQSSQYQNWKANKCSILTIYELRPPVSESSTRSLIMNTNFIKRESIIGYQKGSIREHLDWEPAVITTTLCSTTNGESLMDLYTHPSIKSWNNPGDISLTWKFANVLKPHTHHTK